MPPPAARGNEATRCFRGCRTLAGASLLVLYADAVLRIIQGLFGDGFGPLLGVLWPCSPPLPDLEA
eukprot:205905-Prymnesium_polylepis.1